jgi:hypothetical protein
MKKFFTIIAAATMVVACGEKEHPLLDDEPENPQENQDTIHWQAQDTSVIPLIKRIIDYGYGDDSSSTLRDVISYEYVDCKILQEWTIREKYNKNTGSWELHSNLEFRNYIYSNDAIVRVENSDKAGGILLTTDYYYLNDYGLATRYKAVPSSSAYGIEWNYNFKYDGEGRNVLFFNWRNGNIASTTNIYSRFWYGIWVGMTPNKGSFYGMTDTAEYDTTHLNPFYYFNNRIFLGRNSENLIVKKNTQTYTYEFNNRGMVTKVTTRYATNSTYVVCYEYY